MQTQIGDRLWELRDGKRLSQGDIEKRTGLLRCYVSRIENGHTVPSVETLEKFARALEIPMYRLFYEGTTPSVVSAIRGSRSRKGYGAPRDKDSASLADFRRFLGRMGESDRQTLLSLAQKMWQSRGSRLKAKRLS